MPCPDGLQAGFGLDAKDAAALCFVKSYFGIVNGESLYVSGSGMLFADAGLRHVITAGHNLYSHRAGRFSLWTDIWFRRVGDISLASRKTVARFAPVEFSDAAVAIPEWDFGVARLETSVGADRFTALGLGLSTAVGETAKRLCGYPDEDSCRGKRRPYHADLTVMPVGQNNYGYRDQPTYFGMSGGPLFHREPSGTLLSYGVHIRGPGSDERAVRFSQPVRERVYSWV